MGKAGGILGIIGGIFGVIGAVVTLFIGGLGSAFDAEGAGTVVGLGWGGVAFSFLAIVFGAVAIAKPRGGGIGLVVTALAGAVLGGTLVALCLVLSLIGGVLAIAAKRPTEASSQAVAADGRRWGKIAFGISALVIVVAVGAAIGTGGGNRSSKDTTLDELAAAEPSNLDPTGELSEMFALGSKNTDLQRESKLNEIKGQVVLWRLPVYEVSKSGEGYKIQTRSSTKIGSFGKDELGSFIYLTPRNDAERDAVSALKTGDIVAFKGRIDGVVMRHLQIRPAILVPPTSAAPAVAQAASAAPQRAESEEVVVTQAMLDEREQESHGCSGTDTERGDCISSKIKSAAETLNQSYLNVLTAIDPSARDGLITQQKAWLPEMNETCQAEGGKERSGPATRLAILTCQLEALEDRTAYLKRTYAR